MLVVVHVYAIPQGEARGESGGDPPIRLYLYPEQRIAPPAARGPSAPARWHAELPERSKPGEIALTLLR